MEFKNRSSIYKKRIYADAFTIRVAIAGRSVPLRGTTSTWAGTDPWRHHLWFIWKGAGALTSPSGRFPLRPGACVWLRPGVAYSYDWVPKDPLCDDFLVFTMHGATGKKILTPPEFTGADGRRHPLPEVFVPPDAELMGAVLQRLVLVALRSQGQTVMAHLPHDGPVATASADLLVGLISDLLRVPWPENEPVSAFHREVINKIATRLLACPESCNRVKEMARQAGYSPAHFRRVFHAVMGMNPKQYTLRGRLHHAQQLLANRNLSITDVAQRLGYQTIYAFSSQFKHLTGQSPMQWRTRSAR